ncbi:MAG TPA: hypothetical protein VHO27_01490 [Angustibacter sp.]|nr:hypothetical protein [Angustibacter sp.]
MTAREPSAVEVIAEHFGCGRGEYHEGYGNVCKSSAHAPAMFRGECEFVSDLLAVIRAMTPEQQAEVIGGYVDEGYFATIDGRLHRRALGPWREVQP